MSYNSFYNTKKAMATKIGGMLHANNHSNHNHQCHHAAGLSRCIHSSPTPA